MWRKTRSKNGVCYGVDGNRNFDFKWGFAGISTDPCHRFIYAGPRPFSEPETRVVKNVMINNTKRMKLYVTLHTYGQYLLYPWSYRDDLVPKGWEKMDDMARNVSKAVERGGGKPFKITSGGKFYPAAGGSKDFAHGVAKVPYSYTMELTEGFEFIFPESQLYQALPQFYEGFKTFGALIRKEFKAEEENSITNRLTDLLYCKTLRPCYERMLHNLLDRDEASCVEDAAIGASTVTIFLKALKEYCGDVLNVISEHMTYEGRHLYEVVLNKARPPTNDGAPEQQKPIIIVEAGQQGGTEPVGLALYVIEQLVACMELEHMLEQVTWVVLPCTNPDGQEYSRYSQVPWKKNLKPSDDRLSYGVDITRNFDNQWGSCPRIESGFSPIFPGTGPATENETLFIRSVLSKHKKIAKIYVSIKRDGHAIYYPYGYTKNSPANIGTLSKVAGEVTVRVNQRTSGVHLFVNTSVFESQGKPHCGHSVDYAFDLGIPLSFEMRVFLGSDNKIMSKFQQLPRGYETSLRNGYFSGIREFYSVLTNEKKYGRLP